MSSFTTKEEELTALKNLKILLNCEAGVSFFKFLMKEFDVAGSPPAMLTNDQLREEVAYRRMGGSIIDYITKADPLVYGRMSAELAREKHNEYLDENTPVKDEFDT